MSGPAPKLSTSLAITARTTGLLDDPKQGVLLLYRHIQKQVPHLLKVYAIEEDVKDVRANIKREFMKHGNKALDPTITSMLVSKGQMELDEAMALWKTRTHILKYVYDVRSAPHLARSKISESANPSVYKEKSDRLKSFLAGEQHAGFRRV
mmetsp:Transcript_11548/g.23822  ORF Transcript_11548/g.23822 Transcript_11548/m.23822 type:complete len:151 (+) Transcript_11548:31-483(+)